MTEAEKSDVDNRSEGSRRRREYSTKEWDERSGLYYFGARYYDPEVGRWTQRDPAGTVDGLNLYAYVGNEAANRIDPWGLQTAADVPIDVLERLANMDLSMKSDPRLVECVNKAKKCAPADFAWLTQDVLRAVGSVHDDSLTTTAEVDCGYTFEFELFGIRIRTNTPWCRIRLDLDKIRSQLSPAMKRAGWTFEDELCKAYLHELKHVSQFSQGKNMRTHKSENEAWGAEDAYYKFRMKQIRGK